MTARVHSEVESSKHGQKSYLSSFSYKHKMFKIQTLLWTFIIIQNLLQLFNNIRNLLESISNIQNLPERFRNI